MGQLSVGAGLRALCGLADYEILEDGVPGSVRGIRGFWQEAQLSRGTMQRMQSVVADVLLMDLPEEPKSVAATASPESRFRPPYNNDSF